MRVFLEQGYVGTTMDRIATAAGVSKPTLYS
ncbi:MAG: TetR/AcrR family transcriptional regulator, partial [Phormidesmis sp. CAN_BIN44]|nr:TetR/AcrR family transcriptional regulator [Phormidesmis sp. CAN_BIN44]